eukprot:133623-Amphidinium_carterae.1
MQPKGLLRQSWVLPMPVVPLNPWADPEGRWCEALVLAVYCGPLQEALLPVAAVDLMRKNVR